MSVALAELPERQHLRVLGQPRTRGDCASVPRPCPFERCRYHLAPERGRGQSPTSGESCALDIADQEGATLDVVGRALGVSRERVRQIQRLAVEAFADALCQAGVLSRREAWRVPALVRGLLK